MKNIQNKFLALIVITSVAFSSCKKDDRYSPSSVNESVASNRPNPTYNYPDWSITLFQANKMIETQLFYRYTFKFANDGILKATSNGITEYGYYSTGKKPSPDHFTIRFKSELLSKLNKEWRIVLRTSSDLQLEYINSLGRVERLNFQRIRAEAEIRPTLD